MRSRRQLVHRRQKTVLAILLIVPVAAMLMPRRWTSGFVSLVQVIVPFQDLGTSAVDLVGRGFEGGPSTVDPAAFARLEREKAALEHENAALAIQLAELEEEVGVLTARRLWGGRDHRIGAKGRLVPARVIIPDILTWRESRLIGAGSLQGVRGDAPVVSRHFSIDRGEEEGLRRGMGILLAESLVGFVEQCGTHTSRVQLLSDVNAEMKVRIGHFTEDEFVALDRFFWLTGRGGGVMEIRGADRRDVEAGLIRVGALVLADHTTEVVPAPMTIGKVVSIDPDREQPLLSILTVESSLDIGSLQQVYVYDPEDETED